MSPISPQLTYLLTNFCPPYPYISVRMVDLNNDKPLSDAEDGGHFTDRQRNCIYAALSVAIYQSGTGLCTRIFNTRIYLAVLDLLEDQDYMPPLSRTPSYNAVKDLYDLFFDTGELSSPNKVGRPKYPETDVIAAIMTDQNQAGSVRTIAHRVGGVSRATVARIAKKCGLWYCRPTIAHFTPPGVPPARLVSPKDMVTRLQSTGQDRIDLKDIIFTDECMIGTGQHINRKNYGV